METDGTSFDERLEGVVEERAALHQSIPSAADSDRAALEQRHDELIRKILQLLRDSDDASRRDTAMIELMRALEDRLIDVGNFSTDALAGYGRLGELLAEFIDSRGSDLPVTQLERTYHRAIALLYAGRATESAEGFREACESEESDEANDIKFKSYVILGNISHDEQQYDTAREMHDRSLRYAREGNVTAQALALKALNAFALGEEDEALSLFERSLELFVPDQPFYNAYFHRNALLFSGAIFFDRQDWSRAEQAYEFALTHVEPQSFDRYDALSQLGRICYATGRWDGATQHFRRALQIEALGQTEYQLDTRFWLARAEVKQGNLREAKSLLREVIESDIPYERRPQAEALLARCS